MAAAKPRVVVPGRLWEVHAGLPMEAFWCAHGPECVTLYNFNMPTGTRQPTRKGKPLATVLCYHARFRTAADTLQLTEAGEAKQSSWQVVGADAASRGHGKVGPKAAWLNAAASAAAAAVGAGLSVCEA